MIPALRRWRQEDIKFVARLGYTEEACLIKKNKRKEGREKGREKRREGGKEGREGRWKEGMKTGNSSQTFKPSI
jgi:hypothetical protein